MVEVPVVVMDEAAQLPAYARVGDAGADLVATREVELAPGGGRALVETGIAVAIPDGCAGLVLPRSGLAANHGVTCLNSPGLVDAGYRGELKVLLVNTDPQRAYIVQPGDRIAQLVVVSIEQVHFVLTDELDATARGAGGFGHSGR